MFEKLNCRSNRSVDLGEDFINGQGCGAVSICRYGLFPMSYNGCEIIAAYNLGLMLGIKKPLCEIAKEIYPYGSLFCGLFGTHPYALARYFKDNGFDTHMNKDYYTFKKNFAKHSFGVVSFWNGKSVFKGLHTVAVENFDGGVRVYNKSNKADCAAVFNTLDEYLDSERFICGYYVD